MIKCMSLFSQILSEMSLSPVSFEQLVLKHAQGWPEIEGRDDSAALPKSRERARALGAKN